MSTDIKNKIPFLGHQNILKIFNHLLLVIVFFVCLIEFWCFYNSFFQKYSKYWRVGTDPKYISTKFSNQWASIYFWRMAWIFVSRSGIVRLQFFDFWTCYVNACFTLENTLLLFCQNVSNIFANSDSIILKLLFFFETNVCNRIGFLKNVKFFNISLSASDKFTNWTDWKWVCFYLWCLKILILGHKIILHFSLR